MSILPLHRSFYLLFTGEPSLVSVVQDNVKTLGETGSVSFDVPYFGGITVTRDGDVFECSFKENGVQIKSRWDSQTPLLESGEWSVGFSSAVRHSELLPLFALAVGLERSKSLTLRDFQRELLDEAGWKLTESAGFIGEEYRCLDVVDKLLERLDLNRLKGYVPDEGEARDQIFSLKLLHNKVQQLLRFYTNLTNEYTEEEDLYKTLRLDTVDKFIGDGLDCTFLQFTRNTFSLKPCHLDCKSLDDGTYKVTIESVDSTIVINAGYGLIAENNVLICVSLEATFIFDVGYKLLDRYGFQKMKEVWYS